MASGRRVRAVYSLTHQLMTQRNAQLDLLRGIAGLAVLLVHYPYFKVFELGWVGVELFFVLSGF